MRSGKKILRGSNEGFPYVNVAHRKENLSVKDFECITVKTLQSNIYFSI